MYSPTCIEEEIDKFYDYLDMAKEQCKSKEIVFIMGDLNAKVGSQGGKLHGSKTWLERNERGERMVTVVHKKQPSSSKTQYSLNNSPEDGKAHEVQQRIKSIT